MENENFLMQQYITLREEIKETKARIFRLAGFGIIGVPSSYFLASTFELEILIMSLPVLICTVLLLFLAESRALMRCGLYIKEQIEPIFQEQQNLNFKGWEHWLQESEQGEPGRRIVDIFVVIFFYILFVFYYVASVALAAQTCSNNFGTIGYASVLGIYIGLGIVFIGFLIKSFKYSTCTR